MCWLGCKRSLVHKRGRSIDDWASPQRDLTSARQRSPGVRGFIVATKPGNAGGAKEPRKMDFDLTAHTEDNSASVPPAQQAEAVHPLWRCAKPCVWTMRMLTTLIKGNVEGGLPLLRRTWAVQSGNRPCHGLSILTKVKPSTGEPDAGEPLVRFGGRGGRNQSAVPTPIL